MEIECSLSESFKDDIKVVYTITPKTPVPSLSSHSYELQLVEEWPRKGEENTGEIITNLSGKPLDPRWGGYKNPALHKAGFRTSKGQLLVVKGGGVTQIAELTTFRLQFEDQQLFLVEEKMGTCRARYDSNEDLFVVKLVPEYEQLAAAVVAAIEKAQCQCWRKKCQPHYALSEAEAKQVREERKARQKAMTEKAKAQGQPVPTDGVETEDDVPELKPSVEAPIEPTPVETPAEETPAPKKPAKGGKAKKAKAK